MIKFIHHLCGVENQTWVGKLGYFTSFLAQGTDCRCCLGMRILLAFLVGLLSGALALYSKLLSAGLLIGLGFMLITQFVIYRLIVLDEEEENGETE